MILHRQIEDDEQAFVPAVRGLLDLHERRVLFNEIELVYQTLGPAEIEVHIEAHDDAQDLVSEAQVVLSSFPSAKSGGGRELS